MGHALPQVQIRFHTKVHHARVGVDCSGQSQIVANDCESQSEQVAAGHSVYLRARLTSDRFHQLQEKIHDATI